MIGKSKKMKKFIITLTFTKNKKKYILTVIHKLKRHIFIDWEIASIAFLSFKIISNLEYENKILSKVESINNNQKV
jgi:hypothetical protein